MSSLKNYEYVIAIAECGGISQAAEELHIAQPMLSRYVKKLENELGMELFDRTTLPIRLTRAGELYVETGRRMLDVEHQFVKQLTEIRENKNATVRIGIGPSRSGYMMPAIIKAFSAMEPTAHIVIEELSSTELNARLTAGDLDLIINLADEDTEAFGRIELPDEHLLLAVSKMACPTAEDIPAVLHSIPLISVLEHLALGRAAHTLATHLGIDAPRIECQSIESAFSLVKNGLGATLVPSYVKTFGTEEQNSTVRFLPLEDTAYPFLTVARTRKVCLFFRKEQFLTRTEKNFILCVKSLISEKRFTL